ncbi:MAG: DUF3237 domain-containing protein [Rhizobiaceae bacterium]
MTDLTAPKLEFFCKLNVELGSPIELGEGLAGRRRIIPIIGGTASGPHFEGRILDLGADWQTVHSLSTAHLDTRYAIATNDGATIEIINRGLRHGPEDAMAALAAGESVMPEAYYMRTHATLETGHPAYDWVNNLLFVGTGVRNKSSVNMELFIVR